MDIIPLPFLKFKVLPELMKALEYGGAGTKALLPILKIGAKLTQQEFEQRISPVMVKLFASPDRAMRVALCEHLGKFVEYFSVKIVNDAIFPNLAMGFGDSNAIVREQTLKAIVALLPKVFLSSAGHILRGFRLNSYKAQRKNCQQ